MIRIKDTFVSIDNVRYITYRCEERFNQHYITIAYFFTDAITSVEVDSHEEFEDYAEMMREMIRVDKEKSRE